MPDVTSHATGAFCWIDLGTTDAAGAKRFYRDLLGWELVDSPMPGGGAPYTMIRHRGRDVGGLYELTEEMTGQGIPPHWLSYICVESLDETMGRVGSLGGEIKMGPQDVMDVGRMAVVQDPTGAVFALWQPLKHPGMGVKNEPGAVCWFELVTKDPAAAKKFYTGLIGYGTRDERMGTTDYTFLTRGETSEAGLMAITPEMGPVPSHWMVYLTVADCEATVEKAKSLGGRAFHPPMDVPGVGRFCTLADPQGAVFSVIRLDM